MEVQSLLYLGPLALAHVVNGDQELGHFDVCPLCRCGGVASKHLLLSLLVLIADFMIDLVQYLFQVIVEVSLLAQLIVACCTDVFQLLLCEVVSLLQLLFQALADLHEGHLVTRGESTLLGLLAHVAEGLDEALRPELLLEELAAIVAVFGLLQRQEVVIRQVNLEATLEHQQGLDVEVLGQLLPCMVEELQFHLEGLFQRFAQGLPQLRAYSWLEAYPLDLLARAIRGPEQSLVRVLVSATALLLLAECELRNRRFLGTNKDRKLGQVLRNFDEIDFSILHLGLVVVLVDPDAVLVHADGPTAADRRLQMRILAPEPLLISSVRTTSHYLVDHVVEHE